MVATEWDEFKWLDLDRSVLVRERNIIDARNLLDRGALKRRQFTIGVSVGLTMARVVITGGAGFLSSHLADACLAVVMRSWPSTICRPVLRPTSNLADVANFTFLEHDVSNFVSVPGPVDAVLHFASPASPIDYLDMPIQTLKVGSLGTHNTLGLALTRAPPTYRVDLGGVRRLVHPPDRGVLGQCQPGRASGVYDEAKRFAEAMTMAYHRYHDLDTRIVRIFNTYGPRMRPNDGRVVSNFIVQLQG